MQCVHWDFIVHRLSDGRTDCVVNGSLFTRCQKRAMPVQRFQESWVAVENHISHGVSPLETLLSLSLPLSSSPFHPSLHHSAYAQLCIHRMPKQAARDGSCRLQCNECICGMRASCCQGSFAISLVRVRPSAPAYAGLPNKDCPGFHKWAHIVACMMASDSKAFQHECRSRNYSRTILRIRNKPYRRALCPAYRILRAFSCALIQ